MKHHLSELTVLTETEAKTRITKKIDRLTREVE